MKNVPILLVCIGTPKTILTNFSGPDRVWGLEKRNSVGKKSMICVVVFFFFFLYGCKLRIFPRVIGKNQKKS